MLSKRLLQIHSTGSVSESTEVPRKDCGFIAGICTTFGNSVTMAGDAFVRCSFSRQDSHSTPSSAEVQLRWQSSHFEPIQLINYRHKVFSINYMQEMLVKGTNY